MCSVYVSFFLGSVHDMCSFKLERYIAIMLLGMLASNCIGYIPEISEIN